jgi:enoyl-CoA hydratase
MTIYTEKDGPVTIIILSRPQVRNAVDQKTAEELADAFRSFETDKEAKVAVFAGDRGQFCAGADLKKIAKGRPNRMEPAGDGPMGPTRMQLSKPVIAPTKLQISGTQKIADVRL